MPAGPQSSKSYNADAVLKKKKKKKKKKKTKKKNKTIETIGKKKKN